MRAEALRTSVLRPGIGPRFQAGRLLGHVAAVAAAAGAGGVGVAATTAMARLGLGAWAIAACAVAVPLHVRLIDVDRVQPRDHALGKGLAPNRPK
jgi:hypothetical protein